MTALATSSADTYNDGSANAPAGTPELPNLLSGMAATPPWEVAGVNYYVGVPAGLTLLNPDTISMAGASVNASSHTVTITANNVTLSGYDFSLNGGWSIDIASHVTNTTIENSNFLVGSNELVPVNAESGIGNLTVLNDTFNGGNQTSGAVSAMIGYNGSGTFTSEYCSYLNTPEDAIDFGPGNMTTIIEYNLFQNLGTSPGAHPDTVQYDDTVSTNSVVSFNTITSGEEGIQIDAQGDGSSVLTNTAVDDNTIVAQGTGISISYSIAVLAQQGTVNGVTVDNNYLDTTGAYGPFYPPDGSNLTFSDNVDMVTDAPIPSPVGTASSDVSNVIASPTSGTASAGSTITFTLDMDVAVFVTGTPTLTLNEGGIATYLGGSGTNTLTFAYIVGSANIPIASLAITEVNLPNGASVEDSAGNEANLSGALLPVARTLVWTGAQDDNFSDKANWDDASVVLASAETAPNGADTVEFLTCGGAVTGTGTVACLSFDSGDSWQLVSGADLNVSGTVIVGANSATNLQINTGSSLVATDTVAIANTASASNSSIDVTGAGSNLQVTGVLTVGNAGFGSLSISQGATVTAGSISEAAAASGDGVITVAGTGSALTLTGSLTVGSQAAGELSILNGATVTALDVTIGNASTLSSGNVDVEGAGSTLHVLTGGILNIGVASGGSGVLTIGTGATLAFAGTIIEAGHASFNNNGGVVDPDAVNYTTSSNAGTGLNQYDLYVENTGAVQISSGTGTWDTPMLLTGTSVADAENNITNNEDTGQWQLSSGGTMVVNANLVDAGQAIVFEDATDTLVIGQMVNDGSAGVTPTVTAGAENLLQAGSFQAEIWGYQAGDQILFDNLAVESDQIVNGNTLELFGAGDTNLGELTFFTKPGNHPLGASAMAAAMAQMACFAAGTRIETVSGPVAVEALTVGDDVVTLLGGPGRIVWVGARAVDCTRHPRPETVWPVRIAAGAFGEAVPARDLYLSPNHALYLDGVLIPAGLLVNGTTIRQVKLPHIVYHHIELAQHDVVLADGLPAETYLDAGERANFSGEATIRLFPDFAVPSAQVWETNGAAPLVVAGARLEAVRQAMTTDVAANSPTASCARIGGCEIPQTGAFHDQV